MIGLQVPSGGGVLASFTVPQERALVGSASDTVTTFTDLACASYIPSGATHAILLCRQSAQYTDPPSDAYMRLEVKKKGEAIGTKAWYVDLTPILSTGTYGQSSATMVITEVDASGYASYRWKSGGTKPDGLELEIYCLGGFKISS